MSDAGEINVNSAGIPVDVERDLNTSQSKQDHGLPPQLPSAYLTKTHLAAALTTTKRTLTNYVNSGFLPRPSRFGRDVGWSSEAICALLESPASPLATLVGEKRASLLQAVIDVESRTRVTIVRDVIGDDRNSFGVQQRPLPDAIFADRSINPESDLRHSIMEKLKSSKAVVDFVGSQARQAPKRTVERDDLYKELEFCRDIVVHEERVLAESFIHLHSGSQLVGCRDILSSPLFNVRNNKSPRTVRVELSIAMTDGTHIGYEGPELRQDDGLVFMSLLNIARDVRVGKSVGFSPKDLSEALWGYYDGPSRRRLKSMICRLQEAILQFPAFRVHLVQRFDFPKRGNWTVCLDRDIVQLISKKSVVWLDFNQRLSLANGLTSWLYGYIRSQTRLIPTKVERLHRLSGSEGVLQGFRDGLKASMRILAGARLVDAGWSIDRHDQLHWRKVPI